MSYVRDLAENKARSIDCNDRVILTADTIVIKDEKIYEKPADKAGAFEMLKELNGSSHTVYSGVCGRLGDNVVSEHAETVVTFHQANEAQLKKYHAAFQGTDKAGGYGIQMAGSIIVKKIEGCFYNVMGLPLFATANVLSRVGIDLWDHLNS